MIKSIYVTLETHPELYKGDLNLGLDITGDMILFDPKKKIIYRFPMINGDSIKFIHTDPSIDYIFKSIDISEELLKCKGVK